MVTRKPTATEARQLWRDVFLAAFRDVMSKADGRHLAAEGLVNLCKEYADAAVAAFMKGTSR